MRALVTGGSGFIGIHVVKELILDGWEVTALHRPQSDLSRLANLDVQLIEGDIVDESQMDKLLEAGFDAVFHIAGDVSLWSLRNQIQNEINIEGTRNLVRLCLKHEIPRFIHTSTASVWGLTDSTINEDLPKHGNRAPVNYMRSKFYGEQEVLSCAEEGLHTVILNPCHVMGPFDDQNWAQLFFLIDSGSLPGVPPGLGTFCHVEDVAKAHIQAFYNGEAGQCYILGGEQISYLEICKRISKILKSNPPKLLPKWLFSSVGYLNELYSRITAKEPSMTPEKAAFLSMDLKVDGTKAENVLHYRSRPVDEILSDCFEWLKGNGLVSY